MAVTLKTVTYNVKSEAVESIDKSLSIDNATSPIHAFDLGYRDVSGNPNLRTRLLVQSTVEGKAQSCQLIRYPGAQHLLRSASCS
jgi:hypothetical protein